MSSFEPSEEQAMLIDATKRYAMNDLRPVASDAEEEKELPFDLIEKGWELGILQASIPEEYGGFGEYSAVTGVLAAEELACGDLAGALAIMTPGSYVLPILLCGTEEQKKTLLAPVIEAEWKPYVAAFIEPKFDFYPGEMDTTAKLTGDSYILNGEKAMVPYADKAEVFLVFANLSGKTQAFIVPSDAEGIEIGDREGLLGIQALPTYRLKINDLKVPKDSRVGADNGFDPEVVIASSNVAVAALGIGVARAAYEYALDYAKQREAFGGPIAQKQSIAFMLAEMAMEIEAHRLLVWEAAWKLDEGKEDAPHAAIMALSGVSDITMMVTDRAVQILGGYGYIREYPAELWMRNGRGIPTFPGLAFV
jgi:acyl-CoA dehydrogenase